jgi:hypothetical protein
VTELSIEFKRPAIPAGLLFFMSRMKFCLVLEFTKRFLPNQIISKCLKILELGFAAKYYFSNFAVLKKGPSV